MLFWGLFLTSRAQEADRRQTLSAAWHDPASVLAGTAVAGRPSDNLPETAWRQAVFPQKNRLLYTAQQTPVEYWYFPGTSEKKALVLGGLHGSELSAIEVANQLVKELAEGKNLTTTCW